MCGGGQKKAQRQANEQAEKSYQLQKDMFTYQQEQAKKLEQAKESEEAKKAAREQMALDIKRQGRSSTITTMGARPALEAFKAKFEAENPLDVSFTEEELQDPIKKAAYEEARKTREAEMMATYAKTAPFRRRALGNVAIKKGGGNA